MIKTVCIITEPSYGSSMWGKAMAESLRYQLKKKRIPFEENPEEISAQTECVFLVASDKVWIKNNIRLVAGSGFKTVLLCSNGTEIPGYVYSSVYADISGSLKHMLSKYFNPGSTRAVLYAVNKSSAADTEKLNALRCCTGKSFGSFTTICNAGSLEKCFDEFMSVAHKTDLCIAFNGLAAISLVRSMKKFCPEIIEKIKIISLAQTELSSFYRDCFESIETNYESFGKAAVFIYEKIKKHPYMTGISIGIGTYSENNEKSAVKAIHTDGTTGSAVFYSDSELRTLSAAECFLNASNNTDKEIFRMLCCGFTLEQIAEKCFLTESGVKYRIKRLVSLCGMKNKDELCQILKNCSIFYRQT